VQMDVEIVVQQVACLGERWCRRAQQMPPRVRARSVALPTIR
jgi:hypothetical protein